MRNFILLLVAGWLANPVHAEESGPKLPATVCEGGATVKATLVPWVAPDPLSYAGHYVSLSVTDGWMELELTVSNDGNGQWSVATLWRDDREDDERGGVDFPPAPLITGELPRYQPRPGDRPLFFVLKTTEETKRERTHCLVSDRGSVYVQEPALPSSVLVAGKPMRAKVEPWRSTDRSKYAGTYRSISSMGGTHELTITVTHLPEERLPFRIDAEYHGTERGKDDEDYAYSNRPLWEKGFPHFDAHRTYSFVTFHDPRFPSGLGVPAVVTEEGEVLTLRK